MVPLQTTGDDSKALPTIQKPPTPIEALGENPTKKQIKEAVVFVAKNKDINQSTFVALADCESGFKDICIKDSNGKLSCGIFMFQKATFENFCPDLKWNSAIGDNIVCAGRMVAQGLMRAHWVNCAKKILK